jgi:putative hydrolase of the HAD superfamily
VSYLIFFDIDATLLDHERAEKLGARNFYRHHRAQLNANEDDFIKQWNVYSEKFYEKFLAKELSFQDQRRMRIKTFFGHHLSDEECDHTYLDYLKFYQANWTVFCDVIPCIELLKNLGHSLGIISNGHYSQQIKKLKKTGIRDYFDVIITSSEVGEAKPNKHIFIEACRQAHIQREKCYYIGDKLETDAIGSKKAGMIGIWLNRKDKTTSPEIHTINNLNELTELIS